MASTWFLAPSLIELREEINQRWPNRDKASDGSIGDASHAARYSSHNPLWVAPGNWDGVVRAIDVDNNGGLNEVTPLVKTVMNAAIGDKRVWYVIYARKIYSRTYNWVPRYYGGTNPHDHHVHISLRETVSAWEDTSKWLGPKPGSLAPAVDLSNVRHEFRKALDLDPGSVEDIPGIRRIKRCLRADYGYNLKDDGICGKLTVAAWRHHEGVVGVSGRSGVPDERTLKALAKGRFRVVA